MNAFLPSVLNLVMAACCVTLGISVLARHPRKSTHQAFGLVTFTFACWALGVFAILQSKTPATARIWLLTVEVIAAFIPATFYTFIGYFPKGRFGANRTFLIALYSAALVIAIAAFTPWYVLSIQLIPGAPPRVTYGPAFLAMPIIYLLTVVAIHTNLRTKMRVSTGVERRQIEFVMVAIYSTLVLGVLTNILAPVFDIRLFQAYGPISAVFLISFFAYAMIRYHLLDARVLLARAAIYLAAAAFVAAAFVGITAAIRAIRGDQFYAGQLLPGILAALLIAFLFHKVKEFVQGLVEDLWLRHRYDIHRLYSRIAEHAAEELQLDQLLKSVAQDIQETIGVPAIRVLLIAQNDPTELTIEFTTLPGESKNKTREHGALLEYLRENPKPLILEKLLHRRPDPKTVKIASHLADLDAHFCLPLNTSTGLVGIMTLGQKDSHDIYSSDELIAFHALAGPLGTAIVNARLYRELENLNLHLSNLFRQMREGVIAVDTHGTITTVNEGAAKILGPVKTGQSLDSLTPEVAGLLQKTLRLERPIPEFETEITGPSGDAIPVILSSSCLNGDGTTGAVALIYDLSQVKRLEENVLRADRLSSIGTLAAGMAHEIKNPLVSIKTFSQLLQTRHEDPEFRAAFTEIVPKEVDRIDTIVTRLLDFARPRPVKFEAQNLCTIVQQVLALVENQTRKSLISVTTLFTDDKIEILGDEQQLHQVFLNLILNAIDAMKEPGGAMKETRERSLRIEVQLAPRHLSNLSPHGAAHTECAIVTITDTGPGIPAASIRDLFTPFFTTKDQGSGLGLAVVHGIVKEHGGEIEVSSDPDRGTTFTVALPAARNLSTVEAT